MTVEERRVRERAAGPGWLATAGGALFLIALGFSVGIVAGTAYEEPELVAEHLAGRTTEVVLEESSLAARPLDADAAPDVAAPAPNEPLGAPPSSAKARWTRCPRRGRRRRRRAKAPAAQLVAAGSFSIQVGAFGSERAARDLAGELGKRGYTAYLMDEGEGARFKVRVGPIGSRSEAEQISARLKREQRLPTWIMASGTERSAAERRCHGGSVSSGCWSPVERAFSAHISAIA